jgi:hypothetical protein
VVTTGLLSVAGRVLFNVPTRPQIVRVPGLDRQLDGKSVCALAYPALHDDGMWGRVVIRTVDPPTATQTFEFVLAAPDLWPLWFQLEDLAVKGTAFVVVKS